MQSDYHDGEFLFPVVTEKTDGFAFEFGIDADGFYSRTAHSNRMRYPEQYIEEAVAKFGSRAIPEISHPFVQMHRLILLNQSVCGYLQSRWEDRKWDTTEYAISGDVYWKPSSKKIRRGVYAPVATGYHESSFGSLGTFVIHRHEERNNHLPLSVKRWSTDELVWDSDWLGNRHPWFCISVIPGTTPMELEQQVWSTLTDYFKRGKWGQEVEGYVLHGTEFGQIKVINPEWKKWKDERKVTQWAVT